MLVWRGDRPRVALRSLPEHPFFRTYATHPPVRFAPRALAELDHWVNPSPIEAVLSRLGSESGRQRPYILEVEHFLKLVPPEKHERWRDAVERVDEIAENFGDERCAAILAFSETALDHFREFLPAELWPKLDWVRPACPAVPPGDDLRGDTFTILTIGNDFSGKGLPEVIRAFETLRERRGSAVTMNLVCNIIPPEVSLPEGINHLSAAGAKNHRLTSDEKTRLYRSADVFVLPSLSTSRETASPVGLMSLRARTGARRCWTHRSWRRCRRSPAGYRREP